MKWFEVVKRNQFSVKIWNVNSAWYRDIGPFYIITLKDEVDGDLALLRRMLAANMPGDLLLLFCLMLRCFFFFFFRFFFSFCFLWVGRWSLSRWWGGALQAKSADHLLYVQKSSEWLSSNRNGGWFFFFLLKRLENNKTCPSGEEQPFHSFLGGRGDVLPLHVAGKVKE